VAITSRVVPPREHGGGQVRRREARPLQRRVRKCRQRPEGADAPIRPRCWGRRARGTARRFQVDDRRPASCRAAVAPHEVTGVRARAGAGERRGDLPRAGLASWRDLPGLSRIARVQTSGVQVASSARFTQARQRGRDDEVVLPAGGIAEEPVGGSGSATRHKPGREPRGVDLVHVFEAHRGAPFHAEVTTSS